MLLLNSARCVDAIGDTWARLRHRLVRAAPQHLWFKSAAPVTQHTIFRFTYRGKNTLRLRADVLLALCSHLEQAFVVQTIERGELHSRFNPTGSDYRASLREAEKNIQRCVFM